MHPEAVKKIRIAMVKRGWNQVTLAEHLGISPTYLSLIMNGQRSGTRIRPGIAEILGIPSRALSD